MNDEEIKKALECCGDETGLHWCTDCPYYNKENDLCQEDLNRDSLALINRQQAEIERLQKKYDRAMDNLKAVLKERAGEQDV